MEQLFEPETLHLALIAQILEPRYLEGLRTFLGIQIVEYVRMLGMSVQNYHRVRAGNRTISLRIKVNFWSLVNEITDPEVLQDLINHFEEETQGEVFFKQFMKLEGSLTTTEIDTPIDPPTTHSHLMEPLSPEEFKEWQNREDLLESRLAYIEASTANVEALARFRARILARRKTRIVPLKKEQKKVVYTASTRSHEPPPPKVNRETAPLPPSQPSSKPTTVQRSGVVNL